MTEYVSVAKFLADDGMRTLPIACRLVPLDQWLVTHVDTSWKVKDIKQWILSKCQIWGSSGAPQPPRFRPASPVTFSALSRRSSIDSASWSETEEGADDDDWEAFTSVDYNAELRAADAGLTKSPLESAVPEHAMSTSSFYMPTQVQQQQTSSEREFAATSAQFMLVSFSNGFILEDDADLSWYKPRPFELLEVHRAGAIVSLPRSGIAYAEPYFESPVRVCERPHGKRTNRSAEDQQAHSIEWKPRWAIIRDGVLHLCKDAHAPPTHRFPISALCALHGPEHFGLVTSEKGTSARIICAKFNRSSRSGVVIPGEFDDSATPASQGRKKPKTSSWVILDMPNRSSFENLLRVLHRLAQHPLLSTFLAERISISSPTSTTSTRRRSRSASILTSPSDSETFDSSAPGYFGVQYPEWRLALLQRSRTAGRGAIGSALSMAQTICLLANGGSCEPYHQPLPRAPSISEGLRRRAQQASTPVTSEDEDAGRGSDTSSIHPWKEALSEGDDEDEDYDDVDSEVEWEGWPLDLSRRTARPPPLSPQFLDTCRSMRGERARAISPSSPSSSEADHDYADSGGTARVRTLSCADHSPRSISLHRARSNTVSAAGTAFGSTYTYTSTTTTTITTYLDRVPDLPAPLPSSVPGTWMHHSYASPTPSPPPTVSSPRNTPRARRLRHTSGSPVTGAVPTRLTTPTLESASEPGSRATSVSGSQFGSSVGDGSSPSGRSGGMGGVKRIVRGVSIRNAFSTERFVRGLEDALDFVDGK